MGLQSTSNFDFSVLLKNNQKKHKSKPPQFGNVANGVQKRLQTSLKNRKSYRCTIFDSIRAISETPTSSPQPGPAPTAAQLKIEQRRLQLERWKAEKEKKKKEEMAKKKKPFLAGIARTAFNFLPPPPPPKPSSSGRVTRSQSAKAKPVQVKSNSGSRTTQSIAPENAPFRPPKTVTRLQLCAPTSKNKKPVNITFEPIIPNKANTVRQTRSKTAAINRQAAVESSINRIKAKTEPKNVKSKTDIKPVPVTHPRTTNKKIFETQSSSSGSDVAPSDIKKRIKTPGPTKSVKERKSLTPKVLHLESTTSEEKSSSEENSVKRKSVRKTMAFSSPDEMLNSESTSSVEDLGTIRKPSKKSLPKDSSPTVHYITNSVKDSSDSCSSDVEFISEEKHLKKISRKSESTPKNKKIPKSESSSEKKLRSPKTPVDLPLTPEQMEAAKISPCVTLSRGKDNARKEMKWKRDEGLLDDDKCEGDSIEHFRNQLATETDRITVKCLEWDKILEQAADEMPEVVQELVLAAVGQARLLMSQKMQQFRSLVERCARPEPGSALVTPADLRGFWDMVFMQVENVDMRFKRLEDLQARNWIEEKAVETKKKAAPKNAGIKKATKPACNSRLRDMIAAARKAKKDQESQSSAPAEPNTPSEPQKTFEAGFFCVRSPVRSPRSTTSTPRRESGLLKAVLSNEAKKSASKQFASFAILRATQFSKSVECDGVAPLQLTPQAPQMTPINLYATPGRSILKSNNVASTKKSGNKSIKLVLFDDSDTDVSFTSLVSDKPETARDKKTNEKPIADVENIDKLLDSDMFSMVDEKPEENKENKPKPKLKRQEAIEQNSIIENDERSPILTRQRRKSMQTPKEPNNNVENENDVKSTKRSTRKKKSNVQEDGKEIKSKTLKKSVTEQDVEVKTKTPRQRKKGNADDKTTQDTEEEQKLTRRSTRKKALQELEANVLETSVTPQRRNRARRSEIEMLLSETNQ